MADPQKCGTCRFWSEMIARAYGAGPIEALCLAEGPKGGKYTRETATCSAWKSGHYGAIDSPPNYGEYARAAYEAEGDGGEQ
jgi:hypothetical protein